MQEKKERETERKRKTLSGEKKEVSLKEFDRADIVRDVRFRGCIR
jgi:predicted transcriptional regulator